jgi:phospholipase D1/2
MRMKDSFPQEALQDVQVLITAEEAYPEMERAFLQAETEIWGGYRVFDLSTRLRSDAARRIGHDWFDLVVHTLERGVHIHMTLSDFDPILGRALHSESWKARRAFIAAREVAGPDAKLTVVNAMHSARVGWPVRVALWPRLLKEIKEHCHDLNTMDEGRRDKLLETSPGLREYTYEDKSGQMRPRRFPPPRLAPGTHHQKIAVFDRKLLCVGGLDLDERRYDDKGHHRRRDETWHDIQLLVRGPVVADAQRHLETFLDVVHANTEPDDGGRLLRTLSARRRHGSRFLAPDQKTHTLADAHHALIRNTRQLLYFETQFFRDRRLARALSERARENPDLTMILVMPAAPETAAFGDPTSSDVRYGEWLQTKCVDMISKAFGDRLTLVSPVRPTTLESEGRDTLCGSPIIYVHAKVSVFDEDRAIVSSANLNGRSLYWDTEAGVMLDSDTHVKYLRRRMFRHWLGETPGEEYYALETAAKLWRELAEQNATCAPDARTGFMVPYDVEPARKLGRPLPGVPAEMV